MIWVAKNLYFFNCLLDGAHTIPQIHIHKPLNNLPSPPRLKRRIQKRQNHIITHTLHSPPKPKPRQPSKRPPSKPNQQTSEALTQATSTHIRSPSHTPHQHTSKALLSTLISIHPKLFSQATSAHIRSSSLNPHQHTSEAHLSTLISTHPKPISQATSTHIRSPSLKSHKTVTKTPDINQPVNQSIRQPIRPTIFFHNYNPKYSKNKFKYYTKTPHPIQNSLYPPIPSRQIAKNSPHTHPTQRRCHTTSRHITRKLSPCSHPAGRLSVRPSIHPTKKEPPGPNTQELSQNQTTSSPPQLPQFPLQPIRTRLLPQRIHPLFTPPLFNPLSDSLANSLADSLANSLANSLFNPLGDSLTDPLFNPLINPHLLNLKTLHIRHRNLSIIFNNPDHLQQLPQNIIYRIHLPGIRY